MSTHRSKTLMINDIMNNFKNKFYVDIAPEESDNSVFEKLVAYLMTCKHSSDYDFSIQDICTGQNDSSVGSEMSIDSAAVIVNGNVVSGVDSLENIVVNSGDKVNVSYVFTQAKNKERFSNIAGEYGKFTTGINNILRATKTDKYYTQGINNFIEIKNLVESGVINVEGGTKSITINGGIEINSYFVISGSENSMEDDLRGAREHIANNNLNLDNIGNYIINSTEIAGHETLRKVHDDVFMGADADFNSRTLAPFTMDNIRRHGIEAIYTGYLPFKEYKRIIQDDEGNLRGGIFSENVRGYLESPINKSIKKSLAGVSDGSSGGKGRDLFFAMNNGVTIISKDLQSGLGTGNTMKIRGYQIVNGCQTSNILHEYYSECIKDLKKIEEGLPKEYIDIDINALSDKFSEDLLDGNIQGNPKELKQKIDAAISCHKDIEDIESSICVPVRIIHTKKDDAIDMIISSTNTQNSVNELVLLSRSEFNKGLERYFKNAYNGALRYERRKNQYATSDDLFKYKISMDELLKAYACIYLKSPHESARYMGKLKKKATSKTPTIFSDTHSYESYYLAARIYIDLDNWMRESKILSECRRYRWHMMYAVASILDATVMSKDRGCIKILDKNSNSADVAKRMESTLEKYVNLFDSDYEAIKDIFKRSKESVDEAIQVMLENKIQLNEINKDPEFHKTISNLLK